MRILHTGDWHLGRTLEGRSRQREQEQFVDELVEIADSSGADLILMAGDVYDSVNPPAAAEQLFYEAAARLTAGGRPLVVISGNHDQPERVASVSPLVRRQGITLVGMPTSEPVTVHAARTGEIAKIAALPYPSEARLGELLAGDSGEAELRLAYSARVGRLMNLLGREFTPQTVNLAMSHIYVLGGVESDSERPIQVGGAYTVDPSALSCGAQYTALGHLHRAQRVKGDGMIRYSGSPLAYSFSEAGQAKSVALIEVAPGGEPVFEEIYLRCGRPLVNWKSAGGLQEVYGWLDEGRDEGAFIDLELRLTEAMSMNDIQRLRKSREGIVHIRPVYPQMEQELEETARSRMPVQELFRKFYQRQTGGAEPEDSLIELFLELAEEERQESAEEEENLKEQQEIDFESLTETGLFGIFGPTGSGKSSLLDAITLAMYGKVERAVNGTQGIMNHSEDQLSVAFTFELTSSSGARRYRVERKFKRTGEQSVSNTISRFIEVKDDGDTVMADKLADVTRCVEEHIGLKMDDFTRAVVLPQGKFAEFLSLRGVDRRQMLQRLFHLEQYGDGLALKLSRRVKENEAALRAFEAEQQGLGSAGKEDVEAAAVRVQEAERHAAECRKRLTEAAARAERFARIRELQEEHARRGLQRQALQAQEEQILLLEQKLGKADEAEKRLPALKAWRSAEEGWKSRHARAEALEAQASRAGREAEVLAAAEAAAQAALAEGEPALRQEEGLYRRALELEAELGGLRRERAALQARREEAARGLAAGRESLARERELLARGQKKQHELQQSLQPLA
ncbi:hypothetical protein KC345_g10123, partial [Hortaea werneckii]